MSQKFRTTKLNEEGKIERTRKEYRRRKREIDEEIEKQYERDCIRRGDDYIPERESILSTEQDVHGRGEDWSGGNNSHD